MADKNKIVMANGSVLKLISCDAPNAGRASSPIIHFDFFDECTEITEEQIDELEPRVGSYTMLFSSPQTPIDPEK